DRLFDLLRRPTSYRRLLLDRRRSTAPRRGGSRPRLGFAFFVELDELVFAGRHFRKGRTSLDPRISDAFRIELNGPHGIVVAGNDVIDVVRRAIRVDHRYDGNAELLGFAHRNALMTDVDHEQ